MNCKEISCPFCKKGLPLTNLLTDSKFNLLCNFCKKVVFATSEVDEVDLKMVFPETYGWQRKEPVPIKVSSDER